MPRDLTDTDALLAELQRIAAIGDDVTAVVVIDAESALLDYIGDERVTNLFWSIAHGHHA